MANHTDTLYDVVVVGGGPGGLSAALALGRARKRVLLCDSGPRRNAAAEHVHNFLSRYREWVELGQRLGAVREDLPKAFVVALSVQLMACSEVWFSERADTATVREVEEFARAMTDLSWRMFHPEGAALASLQQAEQSASGRAARGDAVQPRRRESKAKGRNK